MTRKILLRCFLVSLFAAAAVLPVTMVAMAPDTDEQVADLRAIDPNKMAQLSEQEQTEHIKSIPMHRVQGIERITYLFSHPQWLMGWWRGLITSFLFFFASTLLVSVLNARDEK